MRLLVDFSNGPHFPLYRHKCPSCDDKLGPWLKKKDAIDSMDKGQTCFKCYHRSKFNPRDTTPSLRD